MPRPREVELMHAAARLATIVLGDDSLIPIVGVELLRESTSPQLTDEVRATVHVHRLGVGWHGYGFGVAEALEDLCVVIRKCVSGNPRDVVATILAPRVQAMDTVLAGLRIGVPA